MTGLSEHMRTVRVAHIFVNEFIPQKVTHLTCTPYAAGVNGRENAHTAKENMAPNLEVITMMYDQVPANIKVIHCS